MRLQGDFKESNMPHWRPMYCIQDRSPIEHVGLRWDMPVSHGSLISHYIILRQVSDRFPIIMIISNSIMDKTDKGGKKCSIPDQLAGKKGCLQICWDTRKVGISLEFRCHLIKQFFLPLNPVDPAVSVILCLISRRCCGIPENYHIK